ncbi:MAG TPA: hypothetical protein VF318_05415, partial [Dehalococcoidales bacterium]
IESYVAYLCQHPEESLRIRQAGRLTAAQLTWEQVIKNLVQRLEFQAGVQGILATEEIKRCLPTGHAALDVFLTPTDTRDKTNGIVRF